MSLREYVRHPQWWRELLNLIYRLPPKCQWRRAYAHDPDVAEALAAQVDSVGDGGAPEGPERPEWGSYTPTDARLDKIAYYLLSILARTPSPKGAKPPPAPLGPESLVERRVREARESLDDALAQQTLAGLGFTDDD